MNHRCSHALNDRIFSQAEYARADGCCRLEPGCNAALVRGEDRDRRASALATALAAGAIAAVGVTAAQALQNWYRPPPLAHIRFAQAQTETSDDGQTVEIEIRRDALLAAAVDVEYETRDGTALQSSDYVGARGQLHFAPGERRKHMKVTLLRDASHQKPKRHFTLVLPNVAATPDHRITIAPPSVPPSDPASTEALVLSASRIAKDIADLRMKQHVADEMMAASRNDAGAYAAYRNRLAAASGDLGRARERYLQELGQLRRLPAAAVLDTVDALVQRFERDGFAQQAKAARVMKRHLIEIIDGHTPTMDRWVEELLEVIPRVTQPVRDPTTV